MRRDGRDPERFWQIAEDLATLKSVHRALTAIVAELYDTAEVADLAEAALEGNIAFVPLSSPPGASDPEPVDLVAPGMSGPLRLMAQLAGEPVGGGMYPVLLSPVDPRHAERLRAFVANVRRGASSEIQGVPGSSTPPGRSSVQPARHDPNEEALSERRSSVPAPRSRRRSSLPPPAVPVNPDPLIGRALGDGRYRIEFLLGVGGMGRVYNAEHTALAKRIAVKVLDKTFQEDTQFAGRFHQEALAASKLDHPNVMQVLDFGQESDGLLYIAMELLKGENLASKVEREGAFQIGRVLKIMNQVLSALQAAHDRDIVHRDMKPENIVMVPKEDDEGNMIESVKVCDFGLAKMADDRASMPPPPGGKRGKLTMVGTIMGTPEYMSPEQCRGETMDLRTDLYACGVILYELLTGRVPFSSENQMDILGMHCLAQPMSPRVLNPSISFSVEAVIMRAMAKDRNHRYASARELRDALRAAAAASSAGMPAAAPVFEGFEATAFSAGASVPGGRSPSWSSAEAPGQEIGVQAEAKPAAAAPAPAPTAARAPEQQKAKLPPKADEAEALMPAAEALLTGDHATREGARLALISAGTPGVRALFRVREFRAMGAALRPRWVTTVREMQEEALEPLVEALSALDPLEQTMDAALAEDILRAVPESRDPDLARQIDRFLLHHEVAVRRAALQARVATSVPGLEASLVRALRDADEATRLVAIAGVRKLGLVDRRAVECLDDTLATEGVSDELRAAAAAALGDVDPSAKAPAESALLRAIAPRTRGIMGMLRGDANQSGEAMVVEAVAAALLKVGGAAARRAVERRAQQSKGEIKMRLDRLLLKK